MARLIEVDNVVALPQSIIIERGDLLLFRAPGGHVTAGAEVIELIGPFLSVLMVDDGHILSPMGAPNAVLFLARAKGRAEVQVTMGDPFYASLTTTLEIIVQL